MNFIMATYGRLIPENETLYKPDWKWMSAAAGNIND